MSFVTIERAKVLYGQPAIKPPFIKFEDACMVHEAAMRDAQPAARQTFVDLLQIGALAAAAPAAILWVRRPSGGWEVISHGFGSAEAPNETRLRDRIVRRSRPVEFDLLKTLGRGPLVAPPHSMRWGYGIPLRDGDNSIFGVVLFLDRGIRTVDRITSAATTALARGIIAASRATHDHVPVPHSSPAEPEVCPTPTHSPSAAEVMKASEVAKIFSVTPRTVGNWAASGKLPSIRTTGGHLRFLRSDILRLQSNTVGSTL